MKCPNCKKEFRTKTNQQLRYIHDLIEDYLAPVLFDFGNIPSNSPDLAKRWLKEANGYGETISLKFKGNVQSRFVPFSFEDATKEQLMTMIDNIIYICSYAGVVVPEITKE